MTNSTTFGVTLAIIWPLALETTVKGFAPDWMSKLLPFEAGSAMYAVPAGETPAWEGGAIFLGWTGLLILAGAALFNRRDLGSSGWLKVLEDAAAPEHGCSRTRLLENSVGRVT